MRRVMRLHHDADRIVFLGDGLADARACELEFDHPIWQVRGNCDGWASLWNGVPTEQELVLEGRRILLTHGHCFGVKGGIGQLAARAAGAGYDIVLFGHTHEPQETYCTIQDRPIYLFNPGSLGSPRSGKSTYGLLQLTENVILFSHGEVPEK